MNLLSIRLRSGQVYYTRSCGHKFTIISLSTLCALWLLPFIIPAFAGTSLLFSLRLLGRRIPILLAFLQLLLL